MHFLLKIIGSTISVYIAAKLVPGISVVNLSNALIFSIVLGILNVLVKPLILILTLPVNILTLGLFTFIVNGVIILLAASLVPGFHVENMLSAIIFSVVLSFVGWFLNLFI